MWNLFEIPLKHVQIFCRPCFTAEKTFVSHDARVFNQAYISSWKRFSQHNEDDYSQK